MSFNRILVKSNHDFEGHELRHARQPQYAKHPTEEFWGLSEMYFNTTDKVTYQVVEVNPIVWSPLGGAGDEGPQGPQGATGPQGIKGATGAKGDKGDKGDQGIQGIQGLKGTQGVIGEKGLKGDPGTQGIQGTQGPIGTAGTKGDKGDTGAQGVRGLEGPAGVGLVNKAAWLTGTSYEASDYVFSESIADPLVSSMWILIGASPYVSTILPKNDLTHWIEFSAPKGEKGDKGDKGDVGAKGNAGAKGDQGIQGVAGTNGTNGAKGNTGDTGAQGIQGVKGDTGAKGDKGEVGPQGVKGDTPVMTLVTETKDGLMRAADKQRLTNASFLPVPLAIAKHDAEGHLYAKWPTEAEHTTNKEYVDSAVMRGTTAGVVGITPSGANTNTPINVTFPYHRFQRQPFVNTTLMTGVPSMCNSGLANITAESFSVYLFRENTVRTGIQWIAMPRDPLNIQPPEPDELVDGVEPRATVLKTCLTNLCSNKGKAIAVEASIPTTVCGVCSGVIL